MVAEKTWREQATVAHVPREENGREADAGWHVRGNQLLLQLRLAHRPSNCDFEAAMQTRHTGSQYIPNRLPCCFSVGNPVNKQPLYSHCAQASTAVTTYRKHINDFVLTNLETAPSGYPNISHNPIFYRQRHRRPSLHAFTYLLSGSIVTSVIVQIQAAHVR